MSSNIEHTRQLPSLLDNLKILGVENFSKAIESLRKNITDQQIDSVVQDFPGFNQEWIYSEDRNLNIFFVIYRLYNLTEDQVGDEFIKVGSLKEKAESFLEFVDEGVEDRDVFTKPQDWCADIMSFVIKYEFIDGDIIDGDISTPQTDIANAVDATILGNDGADTIEEGEEGGKGQSVITENAAVPEEGQVVVKSAEEGVVAASDIILDSAGEGGLMVLRKPRVEKLILEEHQGTEVVKFAATERIRSIEEMQMLMQEVAIIIADAVKTLESTQMTSSDIQKRLDEYLSELQRENSNLFKNKFSKIKGVYEDDFMPEVVRDRMKDLIDRMEEIEKVLVEPNMLRDLESFSQGSLLKDFAPLERIYIQEEVEELEVAQEVEEEVAVEEAGDAEEEVSDEKKKKPQKLEFSKAQMDSVEELYSTTLNKIVEIEDQVRTMLLAEERRCFESLQETVGYLKNAMRLYAKVMSTKEFYNEIDAQQSLKALEVSVELANQSAKAVSVLLSEESKVSLYGIKQEEGKTLSEETFEEGPYNLEKIQGVLDAYSKEQALFDARFAPEPASDKMITLTASRAKEAEEVTKTIKGLRTNVASRLSSLMEQVQKGTLLEKTEQPKQIEGGNKAKKK